MINNVYFPTWTDNLDWDKGEGESSLSKIPDYINYVTISFLRPDATFKGLDQRMGDFFYDGDIPLSLLKREIKFLRERGKERTILASAGGEIGGNFLKVNFQDLVNGIEELGLDGIDIDYEPNGLMTTSNQEIDKYIELIRELRRAFDRKTRETGKKYLITCAPTGIGLLGKEDEYIKLNTPELKIFNSSDFINLEKSSGNVLDNLKSIVEKDEWEEELKLGTIGDDPVLKQPKLKVGTAASAYSFDSAGKMAMVYLQKNSDPELKDYNYIGQMIDIVFYQAYNMGSSNILGKILCYESHRALSEYLNNDKEDSGFLLAHGSHVGMEAWPQFSYTRKRLTYIYTYIRRFGREGDGASFWSYSSDHRDESENVPYYGMDINSPMEIFKLTSEILGS